MNHWNFHDIPYAEFVKNQPKGIRGLATLFELLTYIRVAQSSAEADFVEQLLLLLPETAIQDNYGNIIVTIGIGPASTLFSCHTDMVSTEQVTTRQALNFTDTFYLSSDIHNQLGADDGAGIWLLLNMIEAKMPGRYIFHRDEEIGGYGSQHIRDHEPKLLEGITQAMAFDRRGTGSVITHMLYERCCSDGFARSLCRILGMRHSLDDSGGFTDVTQYVDLIPECTNISVGYMNAHQPSEKLNYFYLHTLRDKLLAVNWSALIKS